MKNLIKKLGRKVTFIRGDEPKYGELTLIVVAKDDESAIQHIKTCYGENTKIISVN